MKTKTSIILASSAFVYNFLIYDMLFNNQVSIFEYSEIGLLTLSLSEIILIFSITFILYNVLRSKFKESIGFKLVCFLIGLLIYILLRYFYSVLFYGNYNNMFNYIFNFGNYLLYGRISNMSLSIENLNLDFAPILTKITWLTYLIVSSLSMYIALIIFLLITRKTLNTKVVPVMGTVEVLKNDNVNNVYEGIKQTQKIYCQSCGGELEAGTKFCPSCGQAVNESLSSSSNYTQQLISENSSDQNSSGFNALSFFFPVIGLILYLVWKDQYPVKSKGIGKWAIIGAVTGFVFGIIYYLSVMSLINSLY